MVPKKHLFWGIQLEYTRSGQVVTTTWFSQIDYGAEAPIKQYNRFLQGKPTRLAIACGYSFHTF